MLRGCHTPHTSQHLRPGQMLAIKSPILQRTVQFRVYNGENKICRLKSLHITSKIGALGVSSGWIWPRGWRLMIPALRDHPKRT